MDGNPETMKQASLGDFAPELRQETPPLARHKACFKVIDGAIVHPLIVEGAVNYRAFQLDIALRALEQSTLVVIPTGLGKTIIAALVAADVVNHGVSKVVFLAPTKPLAQQHMQSFERLIAGPIPMNLYTGSMPASKRKALWDATRIVFATPQGIINDLTKGSYDLRDVGLVIFDEAHRSVGDYAYVAIAAEYGEQRAKPLVLALTASPGSEREKIDEVVRNLRIAHVEARNDEDPDVASYIKETGIQWRKVRLSTYMVRARRAFDDAYKEHTNKLKRFGFMRHRKKGAMVSKKDIIGAGQAIIGRMKAGGRGKGSLFGALYHQTLSLHIANCLEFLETQGVEPTLAYIDRLRTDEKPKRSIKAFLKDENVLRAIEHLSEHRGVSHPKVDALLAAVKEQFGRNKDSLIIVFSQYRDTIMGLTESLRSAGFSTERFVGQADRKGDSGLSQKEQAEILDRFSRREFNILVASQVAEEGLDIPAVDLVVFYEPIPSAVRAIQRRGRTGRSEVGKVVVLITEDSRDEAFLYAGMGREKKMRGIVRKMAARELV
jgi:Fanconi anemia group M protein